MSPSGNRQSVHVVNLRFFLITVDTITLFFNVLRLPRAAVTIDLASRVDCNNCNHFFADEFRPLDVDISKYFSMRNKVKKKQSLHTCEKQAYISNRYCSRAIETKSVTIAPGLPYLMQLHMFMQLCIPTLLSKEYYTLGAMIKTTKALYNCGLMFTLTCNKPRSSTIHSFVDIHPCWYTCTRRHATSAIYPWLYKLKHGLLS